MVIMMEKKLCGRFQRLLIIRFKVGCGSTCAVGS